MSTRCHAGFLKGSAASVASPPWRPSSADPPRTAASHAGEQVASGRGRCRRYGWLQHGLRPQENLIAIVDVDEKTIAQTMKDKVKDKAKPRSLRLPQDARRVPQGPRCRADRHSRPSSCARCDSRHPLGKHVFCQKPLAHDINECYVLAKAAKEKKVLTQMGNQGYCGEGIRRVAEYIAAGAIGNVLESHTILDATSGAPEAARTQTGPRRVALGRVDRPGPVSRLP